MKRLLGCLLLLGCGGGGGSPTPSVPIGDTVEGIITFYGGDGRGACLFDATSDDFAAINIAQWAGSAACGTCAEVAGPKGVVTVRIVDQCPDCERGQLDLRRSSFEKVAEAKDGRVNVTWRAVSCPTQGDLRLKLKEGSNPYWTAVQVRNHRRPVVKLEVEKKGAWQAVSRTDYNYFVDDTGFGDGPTKVRVTADDGAVVTGTFQTIQAEAEIAADGQF